MESFSVERGRPTSTSSSCAKKIEPYPKNPRYLQTVRGFGYRFASFSFGVRPSVSCYGARSLRAAYTSRISPQVLDGNSSEFLLLLSRQSVTENGGYLPRLGEAIELLNG